MNIDIIDIRRDAMGVELDLGREIMEQLAPERGMKRLPTLLLYDEKGLQTFEEVGYCGAPLFTPDYPRLCVVFINAGG